MTIEPCNMLFIFITQYLDGSICIKQDSKIYVEYFFFKIMGLVYSITIYTKICFNFTARFIGWEFEEDKKISLNCYRLNSTSFLLEALIIVLQYKLRLLYKVLINVNFYLKDCFFFLSVFLMEMFWKTSCYL